jgi:hypothetical protein
LVDLCPKLGSRWPWWWRGAVAGGASRGYPTPGEARQPAGLHAVLRAPTRPSQGVGRPCGWGVSRNQRSPRRRPWRTMANRQRVGKGVLREGRATASFIGDSRACKYPVDRRGTSVRARPDDDGWTGGPRSGARPVSEGSPRGVRELRGRPRGARCLGKARGLGRRASRTPRRWYGVRHARADRGGATSRSSATRCGVA